MSTRFPNAVPLEASPITESDVDGQSLEMQLQRLSLYTQTDSIQAQLGRIPQPTWDVPTPPGSGTSKPKPIGLPTRIPSGKRGESRQNWAEIGVLLDCLTDLHEEQKTEISTPRTSILSFQNEAKEEMVRPCTADDDIDIWVAVAKESAEVMNRQERQDIRKKAQEAKDCHWRKQVTQGDVGTVPQNDTPPDASAPRSAPARVVVADTWKFAQQRVDDRVSPSEATKQRQELKQRQMQPQKEKANAGMKSSTLEESTNLTVQKENRGKTSTGKEQISPGQPPLALQQPTTTQSTTTQRKGKGRELELDITAAIVLNGENGTRAFGQQGSSGSIDAPASDQGEMGDLGFSTDARLRTVVLWDEIQQRFQFHNLCTSKNLSSTRECTPPTTSKSDSSPNKRPKSTTANSTTGPPSYSTISPRSTGFSGATIRNTADVSSNRESHPLHFPGAAMTSSELDLANPQQLPGLCVGGKVKQTPTKLKSFQITDIRTGLPVTTYYHPLFDSWLPFPPEVPDEVEAKVPGTRDMIREKMHRLAGMLKRKQSVRKIDIGNPTSPRRIGSGPLS